MVYLARRQCASFFFFLPSRFLSNQRSHHARKHRLSFCLQNHSLFPREYSDTRIFHPGLIQRSRKLLVFLVVTPALTNYIRPLTSALGPLQTPRSPCYRVGPQSPLLGHHTIRQPFRWHHVHRLAQRHRLCLRIKDRALPKLSTSSSTSCQLRSRGIFLRGQRPSRRRTRRGGFPLDRTSLYVRSYHVYINVIIHRVKEYLEEQDKKKVCLPYNDISCRF